ncbi:hypothetical protein QR680_004459 [Steinernema hermaphroditum]|uniref:ShKT domain-containing protein n=1 Tax=Steinernema hermaphroditum TaxID=289476 RepID=A0AA39HNR9_9BILA|nr:hypothetical protein QR680_004459 [Steinernema hermaphroditum]
MAASIVLRLALVGSAFAQAPMPELCDKEAPTCMLPGYVCDLTKGECVPSATTTVAPNAPGPRPLSRSPSPASRSVECRDCSCPKTCGRCPEQKKENGSGGSEICVDRHAPGRVSDCPQRKHLCDDALYRDLMAVQYSFSRLHRSVAFTCSQSPPPSRFHTSPLGQAMADNYEPLGGPAGGACMPPAPPPPEPMLNATPPPVASTSAAPSVAPSNATSTATGASAVASSTGTVEPTPPPVAKKKAKKEKEKDKTTRTDEDKSVAAPTQPGMTNGQMLCICISSVTCCLCTIGAVVAGTGLALKW